MPPLLLAGLILGSALAYSAATVAMKYLALSPGWAWLVAVALLLSAAVVFEVLILRREHMVAARPVGVLADEPAQRLLGVVVTTVAVVEPRTRQLGECAEVIRAVLFRHGVDERLDPLEVTRTLDGQDERQSLASLGRGQIDVVRALRIQPGGKLLEDR